MNFNYRYDKDSLNKDGTFIITEKQTGNVIQTGLPYENVKILTKKLNHGYGFDGWTPNFFSKRPSCTEVV